MKKLKHGELERQHFVELRHFCNDIFSEWITRHKALTDDLTHEKLARAEERRSLTEEKTSLENQLETSLDAMQKARDDMQEQGRCLQTVLDTAGKARDLWQQQLKIERTRTNELQNDMDALHQQCRSLEARVDLTTSQKRVVGRGVARATAAVHVRRCPGYRYAHSSHRDESLRSVAFA